MPILQGSRLCCSVEKAVDGETANEKRDRKDTQGGYKAEGRDGRGKRETKENGKRKGKKWKKRRQEAGQEKREKD